MQKIAIWAPSTQLCQAISSQISHISTIGKELVKQQFLLHISPQYGELNPLVAEIVSLVWGTPANFNRFCVLAALLPGTPAKLCDVEQRVPPIFGRASITLGIGPRF